MKREELLSKKKLVVVPAKEINDKFTMVSNATITLLDSKSLHVYCYLLSCCDERSYCFPSYDDIQRKINMSRNTIATCIKFLEEFGLIDIVKRKRGTHINNAYVVYGIIKVTEIIENDNVIIEREPIDENVF